MMGTIRLIIWKQKIKMIQINLVLSILKMEMGERSKNPGIGGIVGNIGNDAKNNNTNGDA